MKSIREPENGAIIGASEEYEKSLKVCGNCKSYFRCEMFIDAESDFAERCALFREKGEKHND